jgi:hypothetical protein
MFHRNHSVKSREVVLHNAVTRIETIINHKRIAPGTFLDIEEAGLCVREMSGGL